VEHAVLLTALWTIDGGASALAFAKLKVVKLPAEWQVSQVAEPIGTWFAGTATTGGAPTNDLPAAWQVAQGLPATAE